MRSVLRLRVNCERWSSIEEIKISSLHRLYYNNGKFPPKLGKVKRCPRKKNKLKFKICRGNLSNAIEG